MSSCKLCCVFLLINTLFLMVVHGIDLQRATENENIQCFVPKSTADVNATWLATVEKWYNPLSSTLDLYRRAIQNCGKSASDLGEDELYYNSCITYSGGRADQIEEYSFGRKQATFRLEPATIRGVPALRWRSLTSGKTRRGASFTTLTDNQTFFFFAVCQQGRMTWVVCSTTKTLPQETVSKIHEHALSLGFKREHFTGLRYDSCE